MSRSKNGPKKVKRLPAYQAVIDLCGRQKLADRLLKCLFEHGDHIAANKPHRPIGPPRKAA